MRSRLSALVFSFVLVLALAGCNKSSQNAATADNTSAQPNQMVGSSSQPAPNQNQMAGNAAQPNSGQSQMAPAPSNQAPPENAMKQEAQAPPPPPPPPPPLVIPAGTSLVVRMGNTIDTKTASAGSTFTGTLAHAVAVHGEVAIPSGTGVTGSVVESKSPGKFKGEGTLAVTLTSIELRGVPTTIETSTYAQTIKGKGKRTAVVTGGGAGAGALIGGLAGGGKGALIGGLVGAGAGAAGSAFTGNKDLQIPAESVVTFKLANSMTVRRSGKKASAGAQDTSAQ